jgi:hypothetical protein
MDMAEQPLSNGLINPKQQLVEEHEMALCEATELNDQLELALCEATELDQNIHRFGKRYVNVILLLFRQLEDCEDALYYYDDQYQSEYWEQYPE